jgi:hypothetical protein
MVPTQYHKIEFVTKASMLWPFNPQICSQYNYEPIKETAYINEA